MLNGKTSLVKLTAHAWRGVLGSEHFGDPALLVPGCLQIVHHRPHVVVIEG